MEGVRVRPSPKLKSYMLQSQKIKKTNKQTNKQAAPRQRGQAEFKKTKKGKKKRQLQRSCGRHDSAWKCVSPYRLAQDKWWKCQVGQRAPGPQRNEAAPEVPWEEDRETQEEGQRIQPGKRLARDKNYLKIKMRNNIGDTEGREGERQTQWAEQALRKTRTSGPQIRTNPHQEMIWVFLSQIGCMSQWQKSMCNTCCKSSI